jgi:uncharacterized membrane protein SpoIIM required for sporulation
VVSFLIVRGDESAVEMFMGADFMRMVQERIATGQAVSEVVGAETAVVSAAVMTNNILVSMLCFGGGMLAGTLTVYALFSNGLMLGSFAAMYHNAGLSFTMYTSILPHGICELTAICLSGAAGLRLAGGILLPGQLPRRRSVADGCHRRQPGHPDPVRRCSTLSRAPTASTSSAAPGAIGRCGSCAPAS